MRVKIIDDNNNILYEGVLSEQMFNKLGVYQTAYINNQWYVVQRRCVAICVPTAYTHWLIQVVKQDDKTSS